MRSLDTCCGVLALILRCCITRHFSVRWVALVPALPLPLARWVYITLNQPLLHIDTTVGKVLDERKDYRTQHCSRKKAYHARLHMAIDYAEKPALVASASLSTQAWADLRLEVAH